MLILVSPIAKTISLPNYFIILSNESAVEWQIILYSENDFVKAIKVDSNVNLYLLEIPNELPLLTHLP